mmetsp:Transcript_65334/g.108511  ORF Transcript_65334/g.108511 Transcript_65334/m.108511 type:complete len:271 (-) Transcript_65334:86-898(-)
MVIQSLSLPVEKALCITCTLLIYVLLVKLQAFGNDATQTLARLRGEQWNLDSERRLRFHPYVLAAEAGTLTYAQRRAFVMEQYSIQRSDARSFAQLAGHEDFKPLTLLHAVVPPCPDCSERASSRLFQYLAEGEVYAFSLLMDQARALGLNETSLAAHMPSEQAQQYPQHWSELARSGQRAAGAAAVAVNFPAWGRMCARVSHALISGLYGKVKQSELGFLEYFAEPIEGLDGMVEAILEEEAVSVDVLIAAVRRQQEAEVSFWDAIYSR